MLITRHIYKACAILVCAGLFACKTTESSVAMDKGEEKVMKAEVADVTPAEPETMKATIPGSEVEFDMILIPGGSFTMGSPADEAGRDEDEGPQVELTVEPFWMGKFEVGFEEYNVFREAELDLPPPNMPDWDADAVARPSPPYEDPTFGMGKDGYPAVSMTQFAALQYCRWLSRKSGEFYRLPTEAEWEYACRSGSSGAHYFENSAELDANAWHADNSSERYQLKGQKNANAWGLYDMLGNVSEWTLDQYKADAYGELAAQVAAGEVGEFGISTPWIRPTRLHPRTVRGGSWDEGVDEHRNAARLSSNPRWKMRDPQIPKSFWWNTDSPFVGFRIIKPANPPSPEEQAAFWLLVLGD